MLRGLASLLIVACALGGLALESSQPLHLHQDPNTGLYNEQHVLAALLAAPSAGVPLPELPGAALLAVLAGLVTLRDGAPPSASVRRYAAPRAPPAR
jgi:hypothetical protein